MKYFDSTKFVIYTLFIFLIAVLVYLSFYSQPLIDELIFVNKNNEGFINGFLDIYNNWMSRYTGIIVMLKSTLNFSIKLYFVYPLLTISLIFLSIYCFLRKFTIGNTIFYTIIIYLLLILLRPSLAEMFFWLASTSIYTIPTCLLLFYIVAIESKKYIISLFLQIIIIGGTELNIPIVLGILLVYFFRNGYKKYISFLSIFFGLNIVIILFNEGNAVRQDLIIQSAKIVPSFSEMIFITLRATISLLLKYSLLSFVFFLFANYLFTIKTRFKFNKYTLGLLLFFYFYTVSSTLFVAIYGLKGHPSLRVINTSFFISLIPLFFISNYLSYKLKNSVIFNAKMAQIGLISTFVAYLLIPNLTYDQPENNFLTINKELLSGNINRVEKENIERMSLVEMNKNKDCIVPEKKYDSKIITVENWLGSDKNSFSNTGYRDYFELKSITTE